ncbi:galanin receptor type 2-like isoform X2 [Scylla paramamosain]|uniref:galanin receptor type 2-like isoform X2 n=1 Tax=Scylla paramamosain TaxID=85552 RepID=UPI0030827BAA
MSPSVPFTEMVHASYMGPALEDNTTFFGPMDLTTPGVIEILGNASQPVLERNMSAVDRSSGWMTLTRVAEELNCKDYLDNITTFERNCMPLENPMEMRKPHKANPSFVPIVVTHALTFLLGVSGNSVIVFSMAKDKGTRNVTSWFLVSLAVADLLLLLLCVPLETVQYFLWAPHLTRPICKLSSYFELLSAVASVLNLTAVSLERYLVIVYPMRSRSFCTLSNCRRAIVLVWCISLVLSLPAGYAQDVYSMTYFNATHNVTVYHCATGGEHDLVFAVYRLIIVFLLPALFMSFFYARVIKALWVSTKTMSAMTRVYSISSPPLPGLVLCYFRPRAIAVLPIRGVWSGCLPFLLLGSALRTSPEVRRGGEASQKAGHQDADSGDHPLHGVLGTQDCVLRVPEKRLLSGVL